MRIKNRFVAQGVMAVGPALANYPINPATTEDLPEVCRTVFTGSGGNVVVVDTENNEVTYAVPAGSEIPVGYYVKVKATSTATQLVARV